VHDAAPLAAEGAFDRRAVAWATGLGLPLVLVILLRLTPRIDDRWMNTPAHFWIVFSAGAVAAAVALAITAAARRRGDARLLLIGVAFLVSASFLALHALATPGMIVGGKNAGFVLATPVGLIASGFFAAASAIEYRHETSLRIVRGTPFLLALVVAALGAWAGVSVAQVRPLSTPITPNEVSAPLGAVAAVGVLLYAYASFSYFRVWWRRRVRLAFVVALGFAVLAEALVVAVVSVPTSWHVSWWEWHVLMAIAFVAIAGAASSEWREERFSGLYLEETLAGRREVTVLFADLAGFTPFSEAHEPHEVHAMLVAYFSELTPLIADGFGGEVHEFVGDQIFAIFNKAGDQPDHAVRAAQAGLALQETAERIRTRHPEWPRFRVGINTGPVLAGVVGERGHRVHGVFGDTVNVGARLEGQAPVGGVLVGEATRTQLPAGAEAERVPDLQVKGKAEPVGAFVLHGMPPPTS
jgi:class 3 adenylate cyclase